MGWDSNPRYGCPHGGFQDRCLKPLGHPSSPGAANRTEGASGKGGVFWKRQTS